MWGGGSSDDLRRPLAAWKGVFRTYRTQSHRRSRHVTGTDPDTGWLTMYNFDSSIDLAGETQFAVDIQRGWLYLASRLVPITLVGDTFWLDASRGTVLFPPGCVPTMRRREG